MFRPSSESRSSGTIKARRLGIAMAGTCGAALMALPTAAFALSVGGVGVDPGTPGVTTTTLVTTPEVTVPVTTPTVTVTVPSSGSGGPSTPPTTLPSAVSSGVSTATSTVGGVVGSATGAANGAASALAGTNPAVASVVGAAGNVIGTVAGQLAGGSDPRVPASAGALSPVDQVLCPILDQVASGSAQIPSVGSQVQGGVQDLENALGCPEPTGSGGGGGGTGGNPVCTLLQQVESGLAAIPTLGSAIDSVLAQLGSALGCTTATTVGVTTSAGGSTPTTSSAPVPTAAPANAVTAAADFTG